MSDPSGAPVPTCYRHPDRETYISCQRCGRPICPDCMNSAAVGFQCPDCVKQGAKETRQGKTAYGGARSGNPALTSIVLVAMNAAVWLFVVLTGGAKSVWADRLSLIPRGQCESAARPDLTYTDAVQQAQCIAFTRGDGNWVHGVAEGAWYQVLTSAFTHVEIWHIGFNMLALWILGPQLEMLLGRTRFLAVYLGSALTGAGFVMWFAATNSYTMGASGAIFGLMGALLVVAYKVGGDVRQLLMWIGINFVITVVGRGFISWQGHLGGFLGGLALAAILVYAPRERRTAVQAAGVGGLLVFTLAAIALRAALL